MRICRSSLALGTSFAAGDPIETETEARVLLVKRDLGTERAAASLLEPVDGTGYPIFKQLLDLRFGKRFMSDLAVELEPASCVFYYPVPFLILAVLDRGASHRLGVEMHIESASGALADHWLLCSTA